MNKFNITRLDKSIAEMFWNDVSDATIFTKPSLLEVISHTTHWWGCFSNGNLIAAWPICLNESGNVYNPEFSYYVGPLLSENFLQQPEHRKSSLLVKIYSSFMSKFEENYKNYEFCLDISLLDIRYFLWENHDIKEELKYQISPRFTAHIDSLDMLSETEIQSKFRSVRRQNIKYASQIGFRTVIEKSTPYVDDVISLYQKTLERQAIKPNINSLKQIKNLIIKTPKENLLCVHVHPELTDEIVFFGLILHDKKTANLVLNCTHVQYRDTGLPSFGIYSSIIASKNLGCKRFDFNGANSPNRADDKHSYGAKPKLFFHIKR